MTAPAIPWRELIAQQDGVLSRAQALLGGLSKGVWEWRLERGTWQSPVPGVAVAHTGLLTTTQLLWCAALHAGKDARVSGDAGLVHHGFRGLTLRAVDVVVPHTRQAVAFALRQQGAAPVPVVIHRARAATTLASTVLGPPSLTPHAAVLHAAAWAATPREAQWRLAAAVQQRLTAPGLVRQALEALPQLPRRALVRAVLDDVELGAHAASELAFLRFCRSHRLPLPDRLQVQTRAGGVRYLDARYDRQRLVVELDGRHHMEAGHWEADTLRTLHLVAAGQERVVRLTSGNLRHDGDTVAELLRSLLT